MHSNGDFIVVVFFFLFLPPLDGSLPSQGAPAKQGPGLFVLQWCLPFRVSECCGWEAGMERQWEKEPKEEKKTGYKKVGARGSEVAKESSHNILLVSPLGLSLSL